MNLLCFDPGETTGVAILINGVWKIGLTVSDSEMQDELFQSLALLAQPHVVVVESLPVYAAHLASLAIASRIEHWFEKAGYTVVQVNPGQWKGMVDRVPVPGTHQVDAATMGLWYYRSRLVNLFNG